MEASQAFTVGGCSVANDAFTELALTLVLNRWSKADAMGATSVDETLRRVVPSVELTLR
jgi:hypothetical protein